MTRQQTTYEQWASAKMMWESDHKITFGEIGESLGISKQAVARKARDGRWQKCMDLPKVVKLAYQEADRMTSDHAMPPGFWAKSEEKEGANVDGCRSKKRDESEPGTAPPSTIFSDSSAAQDENALAVAKLVEILARHRHESNAVRSITYEAIRRKDSVMAKLGKLNAETLKIIQAMERIAWGLDKAESMRPQVVVIERG